MNRTFTIFFKTISVVRFLCILFFFILEKLWSDSLPQTGPFSGLFKDGLDIDFPWWLDAATVLILVSFPVNTFSGLAISFKPSILFVRFFRNKFFLKVFFIVELLLLPFYFKIVFDEVNEKLFREDDMIGKLFPIFSSGNKRTDFIEKLQAINVGILFLCVLSFIVFFRKFYNRRLRQQPAF